MKFAVFFRNLNLGRPPAPTRTVLESAFAQAGAINPCSFLTNGTLVFEAKTPAQARRMLKAAQATLRLDGFSEPAALRRLDHLAALVESDPLAGVALDDVYAPCATFLTVEQADQLSFPSANSKGDVHVVSWHDGMLLSLAYKRGSSPGDPNSFVERTLKVPATSRAWNTIVRLVHKHSAPAK
jgi:uncharacterized protein (DUF1697 family)